MSDKEVILCQVCGETQRLSFVPEVSSRLKAERFCYNCSFWNKYAQSGGHQDHAIIDGLHFVVGPVPREGAPANSLGFSGRRFRIKFNDGREITTRNLWGQGVIPETWRSLLPDNARFVEPSNEVRGL